MLVKILLIVIFAAALVFCCWMLVNYWLRSKGREMRKEPGKVKFGSKAAFAMTDFWNAVDEAKEIPKDVIKEELESIPLDSERGAAARHVKKVQGKESAPEVSKKKYRIKENM